MKLLASPQLRELLAYASEQFPRLDEQFAEMMDWRGVELREVKSRRTLSQNARYWPLVHALGQAVGMRDEEMHREVLCEVFGYDLIEWRGSQQKRPKETSSKLTTERFSELLATIEQWCAEEGVLPEWAL